MRRRDFIGLVGSTVAWPLALRAQQGRVRRVGVFMDLAESDVEGQARVAAFRRGKSELGWEEGRNVRFEYRWTAGDPVLMRRYAAALVDLGPEVIMNGGLPTLAAMQQETRTIPIVFAQVLDPVGGGFVDSLARPGGNITGFVSFEYSMAGKWLETLKAVAPHITRVAAIRDLASPSEMGMLGVMQTIMPAFSMPLLQVQVHFDSGESLAELARELVATQPDVIVAISRSAILAARRATSTIPIVMSFIGEDPVAAGLAANITKPGGNVTGLIMLAPELDAKRLELLREAIPDAQRIAVLISNRAEEDQKKATMETIAGRLGAELRFFPVSGPNDYGAAFKSMGAWRAQALAVGSAPELFRDATEIARMAGHERLPTVCEWREMARAGCLLGYGPNLVELRHRTGRLRGPYLER